MHLDLDDETSAADVTAPAPSSSSAASRPDLTFALQAAQGGDEDAFRLLYRDLHPRMLRYLRAVVGADADDIASEVWVQITRDLHSFHGTYERFRAWTATICHNRAVDHLRRCRRRPAFEAISNELTELPGPDDTSTTALDKVTTDTAITLITSLPPDQARAVLLRVVLGLSAPQAAQVLGKRAGTVRTATHRGLRTLAQRLANARNDPAPDSAPNAPS